MLVDDHAKVVPLQSQITEDRQTHDGDSCLFDHKDRETAELKVEITQPKEKNCILNDLYIEIENRKIEMKRQLEDLWRKITKEKEEIDSDRLERKDLNDKVRSRVGSFTEEKERVIEMTKPDLDTVHNDSNDNMQLALIMSKLDSMPFVNEQNRDKLRE